MLFVGSGWEGKLRRWDVKGTIIRSQKLRLRATTCWPIPLAWGFPRLRQRKRLDRQSSACLRIYLVPSTRVYAVDCDMVCQLRRSSTQPDTEARICIIDYESGIVAYNGLVKPPKPVIDYLTNLSSSQCTHTTDYLDGQASPVTTLSHVQTQLLAILAPQAGPISILVGHSLESDLKALRICHPLCIDTALIYYPRGRLLKSGPTLLTEKRCQREI